MIGDRRIVFAQPLQTVEPLRVSPPEAVAYLFELTELTIIGPWPAAAFRFPSVLITFAGAEMSLAAISKNPCRRK